MKETAFDEIFDSQMIFRLLLDSMSRPGRIYLLNKYDYRFIPGSFSPFCLSILKALCDNTVRFYVDSAGAGLADYLELNTGSCAGGPDCAEYAVFDGHAFNSGFKDLNRGTIEFPEDSQTAIITAEDLQKPDEGIAGRDDLLLLELSGPGIKDYEHVRIKGLDRKYLESFIEMNRYFPLGIDMMIVDEEGRLVSIPRTTKLEII